MRTLLIYLNELLCLFQYSKYIVMHFVPDNLTFWDLIDFILYSEKGVKVQTSDDFKHLYKQTNIKKTLEL